MSASKRNVSEESARKSLPEELLPVFSDLVADYRLAARGHHDSGFVPFAVLAGLVRQGWRCTQELDAKHKAARELQQMLWNAGLESPDFAEFYYSHDSWDSTAAGYFRAGKLLADVIKNSHPPDTLLVIPMLFCFRHFLELSVKALITLNSELPGTKTSEPRGHFLQSLYGVLNKELSTNAKSTTTWENALIENGKVAAGTKTGSVKQDLRILREWCGKFEGIDPNSERFRYPVDRAGGAYDFPRLDTLIGISDINAFVSEMEALNKTVHGIAMAIAGEIEFG